LAQREQRVLAGFDFPFGYPVGFASALRLEDTQPWLTAWRKITGKIMDRGDNSNKPRSRLLASIR